MLLDFRKERDRIFTRYPFFDSGEVERHKIFGDWMQRKRSPYLAEPMHIAASRFAPEQEQRTYN